MFKLILVILGFLLWKELCVLLIGGECTSFLFLTQAILCRIFYATDNKYTYNHVETLEPEVVPCTIH